VRIFLIDARTSCDDVTVVVMTTAVGVASFVGGALAGALVGAVICCRRPSHYFVSRTRRAETSVYSSSVAAGTRLSSTDSSLNTDDVFMAAVSPPHHHHHPDCRMTVSSGCRFKRQLMLNSTGSNRTMRTKLDSVDIDDDGGSQIM